MSIDKQSIPMVDKLCNPKNEKKFTISLFCSLFDLYPFLKEPVLRLKSPSEDIKPLTRINLFLFFFFNIYLINQLHLVDSLWITLIKGVCP